MAEQVNAAARLVAILEAVAQQPHERLIRAVWATVFDLPETETGPLLDRLAAVLQLVQEARQLVESVVGDQNRDLHLQAFTKLNRALSLINFESSANPLVPEVRGALEGIRFSADLVSRFDQGGVVNEDELQALLAEVDALLELLLESSLPAKVKELLVQRLEAVRAAILEIRLRGTEDLEEALDSLLGTVVRTKADVATQKGKMFDRFGKLLDMGYKLVLLAEKLPPLAAPAIKLLKSALHGDAA